MATIWRNRLSGAIGPDVNLTTLNVPPAGPSTITGQSIQGGSFVAPTGTSGQASVLQTVITANAKSRVDCSFPEAPASSISVSFRVRLEAMPTAVWQLLSLQVDTPSQRTAVGVNMRTSADSLVQFDLASDAGTHVYKSTTPATYSAGKWWRVNVWADIDAKTMGFALRDEADQVVSTQSYAEVDLGTANTTKFVAVFAGKSDAAANSLTAQFSEMAINLGEAKDLEVPSFKVDTPPTLAFIPDMTAVGGQRVQVYSRATPTTEGATEGAITVQTISVKNASGGDYPEALAAMPAWGASTATTTEALASQRTKEAVMPYLPRTAVYTLRTTGTDSTGLTASRTHRLTVRAHPLWIGGKPAMPS